MRRMHRELIDSYDEELELELEDRSVDALPDDASAGLVLEGSMADETNGVAGPNRAQ